MANILIISANLKSWEKNSGGVERTATLAEALADHNVTFLCFAWDTQGETKRIGNNILFVRPGNEINIVKKHKFRIQKEAKDNHDITKQLYKQYLKTFSKKVSELSAKADLVILDHASASPFLEDVAPGVPILYNSHNAEQTMASQIHPHNDLANKLIAQIENNALSRSVAMTYCSEKDFEEVSNQYSSVPQKTKYIPNGTEIRDRINPQKRLQSKDILFVGSGHPPNVVAVKKIIEIAKLMPKYNFVIAGGAGNGIDKRTAPDNVYLLGVISDIELDRLFSNSLAFINPMDSGSGTHLKMMKALSYGIPIITSAVGARGFSAKQISSSMLLVEDAVGAVEAIKKLSGVEVYKSLSVNGYKAADEYDWAKIKKSYASFVNEVLQENKTIISKPASGQKKEKILLYSIVRNIEPKFNQYYNQIKSIVETFKDYEFYLSIYENDSTDRTKARLHTSDWSFINGVSIITENIDTEFFGSVKDPVRVENLSNARNKAIEAGGFLDKVDYVLMVEGDLSFNMTSVKELLDFKKLEPKFDVVSAVSIRKNGTHYDWWATRTGPKYVTERSELDPNFNRKHYGSYYSTSNGLVLYRAEPFKRGVRHGWINTVTKEFDCEMVVLCQNFRSKGYNNIFINYKSKTLV